MEVTNLDIDDDNMEISCEIHWGRRFEDGNAVINVYGKYKTPFSTLDNVEC